MRVFTSEFIATFFLVFFGTGAIVVNQVDGGVIGHLGISLVFGSIVAVMIYAFGPISGSHMNPAVSLAMLTIGRLDGKSCLRYIVAQLLGAIAASACIKLLFPGSVHLGATLPTGGYWQSVVLEFIMSFALMLVVSRAAIRHEPVFPMIGFIIGSVVFIEALMGGPISGASMNPARSIGPALLSFDFSAIEVYVISPIAAMILAVKIDRW